MKRLAAGLAVLAALAGAGAGLAQDGEPGGRGSHRRGPMKYASPGAVVAAEVAFQQLVQRKGQWTAFREMAAPDAVMFVPQPVVARDWLKRQANPTRPVTWQPHQVWMSCDGTLAVTYGASQRPDGSAGYFTTAWQRQKNGDYLWVMDQGDALPTPLAAPEMIGAGVAACERGAPKPTVAPTLSTGPGTRSGTSEDGTLRWSVAVDRQCGRTLSITLYRGAGKTETVLDKQVAPPIAGAGKSVTSCAAA